MFEQIITQLATLMGRKEWLCHELLAKASKPMCALLCRVAEGKAADGTVNLKRLGRYFASHEVQAGE